uniref:Insulin-like growth factor-binding protein complex acid labile subunit n=1 Tax=Seriola lalandi dorsalis TaxID=1841481 RepID=A0A3B4WZ70_SERLL
MKKMFAGRCAELGALPLLLLLLLLNAALGFKLCPNPCLCYESSDLVDCRSSGLVRVPVGVPHGTWLLDMSGNKLTHLGPASLGELENLRKLDLSHNRIRAIDVQGFNGLLNRQQSLEVLLLSHNNISLIETEALAPLFKTFLQLQTTSTGLQLSLNPWTCDCELQRVFSKIQHVRHLHVEDYKDIVCHAPAQQAGNSLASLDSQLCVAETASVLAITITVMLAVIGALVKAEHNQKNKQTASDADVSVQKSIFPSAPLSILSHKNVIV